MGYSTDFYGDWTVTPPLKPEHRQYLLAFNETRRMQRDAEEAEKLPDPIRLAAGLPIGFEGAYYVGGFGDGNMGQTGDASVVDSNNPPGSPDIPATGTMADFNTRYAAEQALRDKALDMGIAQPGLWCQWRPNEDGTAIEWDGGEKFYEYEDWIEYLVHHFLEPWGYKLNGQVNWEGEESGDMGLIEIVDNEITVKHAVITYS